MKALSIVLVLCGLVQVAAARPKLVATFDSMVLAGELDQARVRRQLAVVKGQLAACLGADGPTTTELSLSIVKNGIAIRNAWQDDKPVVPACLMKVFPGKGVRSWATNMTTVYVVVKAGPAGSTWVDAPALEERRGAFERMLCNLEQLSGADKLDGVAKQKAMIQWGRDHVKHPAPIQVASDYAYWGTPEQQIATLTRKLKAEGITACPMLRW